MSTRPQTPSSNPPKPVGDWHFVEALAAWFIPGLGHYLMGERRRGSIICATILILWASGLLIGGVSVIDHKGSMIPGFLGQMLLAPSLPVDLYHQHVRKGGPYTPINPGPFEPSLGSVYDQGVLYTSLAGLLNLLAIIDVLYRDPTVRRQEGSAQTPPKPRQATLSALAFVPIVALSYLPFRNPLPLDRYWLVLMLPMVLAISVAYKAIKMEDLSEDGGLPRQAAVLAGQITLFMVLAGAGLWFLTEIL
ncbi:MAG: hypothetical protein GC164_11230 [Phycisphaera sp.]|nr:hypothetical protein [Phycisphaera sp.]